MDERLKKQLDFALEIDKEKNIFRQTHLSGHGRNENDAEHAWHMAIMTLLLSEYANEEIDVLRVLSMLLIHIPCSCIYMFFIFSLFLLSYTFPALLLHLHL